MKSSTLLQKVAVICVAASASLVYGQTTAIQLFGPVDVRPSTSGSGYGDNAVDFNSTILNLTCPSPVHATISSSTDGTGNVLVDNYIALSVVGWGTADICRDGTVENWNQQNCFTNSYRSQAENGGLNGKDPDNYVNNGGVPPIDISRWLTPGTVQAQLKLVDTGGYFTGSTLYLVTNCTSNGVAGPGKVTGNPIPQSGPTNSQLAQNYAFNPTTNQKVQFTYDLTQAQAAGTLTITDGTVPTTADTPLDPTTFQSTYLSGTSFATANCFLHTGELYNGLPACKLYTLTCQVGTNSNQSGALCPRSTDPNEIFQEAFDGPSFTLPDISVPNGPTFHQGIGFLMAKDGWNGGSCVFDSGSGLAGMLCPQNLLSTFSGPGLYTTRARSQNPNSTFISVAPVPEDLTTVSVAGQQPGYWINSQSALVNFVSTPPTVPGQNSFVAAPIENLTYGISSASNVPQPGSPVAGDIVLTNSIPCPTPGAANPPAATVFTPPAQPVTVTADGSYLLHYLAQDCAGTEELKFTQSGGSWSTSFYTFPINVDTVLPAVASGPTLSPAPSTNGGVANSYLLGQQVTATYSCTDDRSGVVKCGTSTYPPGTLNTGILMSPVDTSKAGKGTFTVNAVDAAGNPAMASVNYLVVAPPPVHLAIAKLAPPKVKPNQAMTYGIGVANFGKQAASTVAVTDPLPAGVTFVRARVQQPPCGKSGCSSAASCSFANNTVSCTTPSLTLTTPLTIEIDVTVNAAAGTTIKNTATVSSTNPEASDCKTQSTAITYVTNKGGN